MKTSRIRFLLISVLVFTLASCATTVKVNLTRPAELDLNGARTIAVLPFTPSHYVRTDDMSIGKKIVISTFYQLFDIEDKDEQLAIDTLRSQIERGLLSSPYIKVVSSDSVEASLRKGTLNPADVYLTGEVVYFDVDNKRSEEKKMVKAAKGDQKAEYQIVTYWKKEVKFKFRYTIIDSSTNKVIAVNSFIIDNVSSKYESKSELPASYYLIDDDLKKYASQILRELQPYAVVKSIKLLEPKTKDKALKQRMKTVDEMAENSKLIAKASEEYSKIYEETGLVEAGYNAAILQEALGNLSKAEKMMMEVYEAHPDRRVENGLSDIRYEIKQALRLKKQINATEADGDLDDF